MFNHTPRVLVVTADERWRDCCTQGYATAGCEVSSVENSMCALDIFERRQFDVVVADDSPSDILLIEFMFNVRDLAPNGPVILFGGTGLEAYRAVWQHGNVFFTGSKDELLSQIPASVERARSCSGKP